MLQEDLLQLLREDWRYSRQKFRRPSPFRSLKLYLECIIINKLLRKLKSTHNTIQQNEVNKIKFRIINLLSKIS